MKYMDDSAEVLALKQELEPGMPIYRRKSIYSRIRSQRLREAQRLGTHTKDQWISVLEETGYICVKCGCTPEGRPCKDHIVPIFMGGSDGLGNLQPLCRECNTEQQDCCTNWLKAWRDQHK